MNSLEFINKEIEYCHLMISKTKEQELFRKSVLGLDPNHKLEEPNPYLSGIIYYRQRIDQLQLIKIKLEAWKSIEPDLVVTKRFVNLYENDFTTIELKNGCIDELESGKDYEKIDKILKALEVNKND